MLARSVEACMLLRKRSGARSRLRPPSPPSTIETPAHVAHISMHENFPARAATPASSTARQGENFCAPQRPLQQRHLVAVPFSAWICVLASRSLVSCPAHPVLSRQLRGLPANTKTATYTSGEPLLALSFYVLAFVLFCLAPPTAISNID